jgi:hypothetical protein
MLTFAAPWIMWLAGIGVLALGALHLLSVRQPPELLLPTARFVPDGTSRAVARRPRPNDLLLLLLRVLVLLAAAAAVAGTRCTASQGHTLQLVAYDAARPARDTVRWRAAVTRTLPDRATVEWIAVPGLSQDPGGALVRALQHAGGRVLDDAGIDSVALTVLVPSRLASRRSWDAWRGQWAGRVQLMATDSLDQRHRHTDASVALRLMDQMPDDVVASALRQVDTVGRSATPSREVQLYRQRRPDLSAMSTVSAIREVVLVDWPIDGRPSGWVPRDRSDMVGAVVARGQAVVGPWARVARPGAALLRDSAVTPIAWWGDGEVAAVERRLSSATGAPGACLRSVAMRVPAGTDLLLGSAAEGLRRAVRAPCGGAELLLDALDTTERAQGDQQPLLRADALRALAPHPERASPPWLPVLLGGIACLGLLAEWWWRRREDAR